MSYDKVATTAFLKDVEGFSTRGYIPCWVAGTGKKKSRNYFGDLDPSGFEPMYSSGVTAGVGCDFGQTSATYLAEYRVDYTLIKKVTPYLGLKKMSAAIALHKLPLDLTHEEATHLSEAVHEGYARKFVIPGYNRDAVKLKFSFLPTSAQICIMSMCYQKGVGGVRRDFVKTWAALCRCDWKDAYNRLTTTSLWKDFQGRRRQEGELLLPLL